MILFSNRVEEEHRAVSLEKAKTSIEAVWHSLTCKSAMISLRRWRDWKAARRFAARLAFLRSASDKLPFWAASSLAWTKAVSLSDPFFTRRRPSDLRRSSLADLSSDVHEFASEVSEDIVVDGNQTGWSKQHVKTQPGRVFMDVCWKREITITYHILAARSSQCGAKRRSFFSLVFAASTMVTLNYRRKSQSCWQNFWLPISPSVFLSFGVSCRQRSACTILFVHSSLLCTHYCTNYRKRMDCEMRDGVQIHRWWMMHFCIRMNPSWCIYVIVWNVKLVWHGHASVFWQAFFGCDAASK